MTGLAMPKCNYCGMILLERWWDYLLKSNAAHQRLKWYNTMWYYNTYHNRPTCSACKLTYKSFSFSKLSSHSTVAASLLCRDSTPGSRFSTPGFGVLWRQTPGTPGSRLHRPCKHGILTISPIHGSKTIRFQW